MDSLGHFLKEGRREAGLSLEELAQRTRIRIESLESLEREDLESLPTEPYVRGFVKLVCRELGLAPQEGLVRYETLRAAASPPDEILWSEERTVDAPGRLERALENPEQVVARARSLARYGIWAGGGLLAVLLVWGVTRLFPGGDATPPAETASAGPASGPPAASAPPVVSPAEDDAEAAPPDDAPAKETPAEAEPDDADPAGAPADDAPPAPPPADEAPAPVRIDPLPLENVSIATPPMDTVKPESILVTVVPAGRDGKVPGAAPSESVEAEGKTGDDRSPPPVETAAAARQDRPAGQATRERDPSPEPAASNPAAEETAPAVTESAPPPAPTVVPRPPAGDRLVLEVEALRDVQVTVLLDGVGFPRSRTLTAGSTQSWKADGLFLLSADDGGALRIRLGGRDLGVPGGDGVPLDRMELRAGS